MYFPKYQRGRGVSNPTPLPTPGFRCGNSRTSQSRLHKNHRRINSSTLAIGGLSECDFKIQKLLLSTPKYSPIRQDCLRFWLDNNNF